MTFPFKIQVLCGFWAVLNESQCFPKALVLAWGRGRSTGAASDGEFELFSVLNSFSDLGTERTMPLRQ